MLGLTLMDIAQMTIYVVLFVSLYFEIFLLITFFEHVGSARKIASPRHTNTSLPYVAVIVPCFNEEATVAGTLNSLLALEYPADKLEIIAVNDGSTDTTLEVLREFEHHQQIRIIDKENGGKHSAMNAALEFTNAEIIGCLDADSFVEPEALAHIISGFNSPEVAAVTPTIKVHNARGVLQLIQRAEYNLSVFIRNAFALMDAQFITPGPFSFFRRNVIKEVGPWRHAHSTEDLEMCLRLQRNHHKVANAPNAIVYTTAPHTLKQLYKQRVRWTYGFVKNAIDYYYMFFNPRYGNLGLLVLPLSIVSLMSGVLLFSALIWNTTLRVLEEIVRFQAVGISIATTKFDPFYINTSVLMTVIMTLLVLTLILMGIGKYLAKDRIVSIDMPIFMALYGFITPFWLTGALYKAVTSNNVRWR